jgi:hypothetical protein
MIGGNAFARGVPLWLGATEFATTFHIPYAA